MTTYDPKARRLLTESEVRAEQIVDSLRELYRSRRDIERECADQYSALTRSRGIVQEIGGMISTLRAQLSAWPVKECDCCGEMRCDVISVAHPSFGDTSACAACRHDFDDDDQEQQWRHETNV